MNSHQSILAKISILQKKMEALRENEKKLVVAEIRKLIEIYGVRPSELFPDVKPGPVAAARKRASSKRIVSPKPPKYRDPATGKTWNGHGKRPFWLVGDRDAYLMTAQEISSAVKPKTRARKKPATGKQGTARATKKAVVKKSGAAQKRAVKSRTTQKAATPKLVSPSNSSTPLTPPPSSGATA
jgi:DNA-binding protein H-NS